MTNEPSVQKISEPRVKLQARTVIIALVVWLVAGTAFWAIVGKASMNSNIIVFAYGLGFVLGLLVLFLSFISQRTKVDRATSGNIKTNFKSGGM